LGSLAVHAVARGASPSSLLESAASHPPGRPFCRQIAGWCRLARGPAGNSYPTGQLSVTAQGTNAGGRRATVPLLSYRLLELLGQRVRRPRQEESGGAPQAPPPLSNSAGHADPSAPWGPTQYPCDANALRVVEIRVASSDTASVVSGCGPAGGPQTADGEAILAERPHLDLGAFDPQEGPRSSALPKLGLAIGHGQSGYLASRLR